MIWIDKLTKENNNRALLELCFDKNSPKTKIQINYTFFHQTGKQDGSNEDLEVLHHFRASAAFERINVVVY